MKTDFTTELIGVVAEKVTTDSTFLGSQTEATQVLADSDLLKQLSTAALIAGPHHIGASLLAAILVGIALERERVTQEMMERLAA